MVLTQEQQGRTNLSTRQLEKEPGDMLRNPAKVFEGAEEMAVLFRCASWAQGLALSQSLLLMSKLHALVVISMLL